MPRCLSCHETVSLDCTTCPHCGDQFKRPRIGLLESRISPELERKIVLPDWVATSLALLAIGGAAWGITIVAVLIAKNPTITTGNLVFQLIFASMFALGAWSGIALLQRRYGWLHLTRLFWALQIPIVITPVFGYAFHGGAFLNIWVAFPPIGAGWFVGLGGRVEYNLFRVVPYSIGVNLVALAISVYLARAQKLATSQEPHPDSHPEIAER